MSKSGYKSKATKKKVAQVKTRGTTAKGYGKSLSEKTKKRYK